MKRKEEKKHTNYSLLGPHTYCLSNSCSPPNFTLEMSSDESDEIHRRSIPKPMLVDRFSLALHVTRFSQNLWEISVGSCKNLAGFWVLGANRLPICP